MKYAYLGLWEFYGSITEVLKALEAKLKQNGGGGYRPARPGELGCFHLKQGQAQNPLEGPRFDNCYLHPHFTKYTRLFFFFLLILFS